MPDLNDINNLWDCESIKERLDLLDVKSPLILNGLADRKRNIEILKQRKKELGVIIKND